MPPLVVTTINSVISLRGIGSMSLVLNYVARVTDGGCSAEVEERKPHNQKVTGSDPSGC